MPLTSFHVVHCAESIAGGIASYLRDLIALQAQDFGAGRIAVVVPASQSNVLVLPAGVVRIAFDDSYGRVRNALALARAVRALVRATPPRNVHVHSTFAGVMVRLALVRERRHLRLLYCAHGWAWDHPLSRSAQRAVRAAERLLAFVTDRVICISQHDYDGALRAGLPAERLVCIPNGIAATELPSAGGATDVAWPPGATRLLFIGRLDRQKGADVFCTAVGQLGARASGILVGDSVLGDTAPLTLPPNVRHAGWRDAATIARLLAAADALVVPSRWEGFGLVAVEAMRAGRAVVASRVGGLREIVVDGETGYLVEPDQPGEIVSLVAHTSAEAWRAMGARGRARYRERFTSERMHAQIAALYA